MNTRNLESEGPLDSGSQPEGLDINFSLSRIKNLLFFLGWPSTKDWLDHWFKRGGSNIAHSSWPTSTSSDWIWGIGLPFLTDIERFIEKKNKRCVIGISGLPGCGKSSLGKWIEAAAEELKWAVSVVSMDDFYLPANELDLVMSDNPWKVPRGLPGSHDLNLFKSSIDSWKETGELKVPQFDKSLRNGLGDRSGWRDCKPNVLIVEGWFLACKSKDTPNSSNLSEDKLKPPLTEEEIFYRGHVQVLLKKYEPIWEQLDHIWHLKATDFKSTESWKMQQEENMEKMRGASLKGKALESFIRMINASIPQSSLMSINADIIAEINSSRELMWIDKA